MRLRRDDAAARTTTAIFADFFAGFPVGFFGFFDIALEVEVTGDVGSVQLLCSTGPNVGAARILRIARA